MQIKLFVSLPDRQHVLHLKHSLHYTVEKLDGSGSYNNLEF